MESIITKRLFQGFIYLHILHHASEEPFYGSWMLEELSQHGYKLSPGTLYPMLHGLEKSGILSQEKRNVGGKIRKYYSITPKGREEFAAAREYLQELIREVRF